MHLVGRTIGIYYDARTYERRMEKYQIHFYAVERNEQVVQMSYFVI